MRTCKHLIVTLMIYAAVGLVTNRHLRSSPHLPDPFAQISRPPSFLVRNMSTMTAQTGDTAVLPCNISDKMKITNKTKVMWMKKVYNEVITIAEDAVIQVNDQRFSVTPLDVLIKNPELRIRYTKPEDETLYICKVFLDPPEELHLILNLTQAYAEILGKKPHTLLLGSPLRLSCFLKNSIADPAYIFWYQDGRVINYDQKDGLDVIISRSGSELYVPRAERRHGGNYSCVPSNARQADVLVVIETGEPAKQQSDNKSNSNPRIAPEIYGTLLFFAAIRLFA